MPDGFPNKQAKCPKCGSFVPVPQPEEEPRRRLPPWVIALLIGLLGGTIGALYPALRAARQDAVEALSYE